MRLELIHSVNISILVQEHGKKRITEIEYKELEMLMIIIIYIIVWYPGSAKDRTTVPYHACS